MTDQPAGGDGRRGYVELPPGWERVSADGPGPFVTRELLRRPDGRLVRWRSRAHRKRADPHDDRDGVWWRPDRMSWWMGVLFAVGAGCFAVASTAAQWSSASERPIDVTFFVGSLFFTTAAYLQYAEAVNVPHAPRQAPVRRRLRPVSWEPRRIDWLAAAVQLAGTVLFNISTLAALRHGLSTQQVDRRLWAPDALGSICFLLASALAYAEVCHRWWCRRRRSLSWRIVALNLAGSVAFGAAAIASLVAPSTGLPLSARIANAGTTAGALCFLVAAVLLVPEAASPDRDDAPVASPDRVEPRT